MATEPTTTAGPPPDWEPPRRVSVEEYLRINEASEKRYEYDEGVMYVRGYPPEWHVGTAGGTEAHGELTLEVQGTLRAHLRGGPCRLRNQDLQLWVSQRRYYYPDAFVTCGGYEPRGVRLRDAVLVVEVLSEGTERADRGRKMQGYLQLPGLRDYLLLDSERVHATLHRRVGDAWQMHLVGRGDVLRLESIGLDVPLDALYETSGLLEAEDLEE